MGTNIEWTDLTDNIIVVEGDDGKPNGWWCRRCSEGCDNCYSARLNQSDYFGGNHLDYTGAAPKLMLRREILAGWKRQRTPKRHFVASMTDIFGEWVLQEWIFEFLDGMATAPLQTFQLLTKRARRMKDTVIAWLLARGLDRVPPHIWLGVSVENQKWADIRIADLIAIPCVRFLSVEPMLGPVRLWHFDEEVQALRGPPIKVSGGMTIGTANESAEGYDDSQPAIDWVICGGESGPGARPMHPVWARNLRDQCLAAGVPFFFKQWGEWRPLGTKDQVEMPGKPGFQWLNLAGGQGFHGDQVTLMQKVGKKAAGRALDNAEWSEFPRTEVHA